MNLSLWEPYVSYLLFLLDTAPAPSSNSPHSLPPFSRKMGKVWMSSNDCLFNLQAAFLHCMLAFAHKSAFTLP